MQNATLWRALLGVEKTVIEGIEFDEDEQFVLASGRGVGAGGAGGAGGAAAITGL